MVPLFVCTIVALGSLGQAHARASKEPSEWHLREVNASIEEMQHELKGAKVSLELAEERLFQQDKTIASLRDELRQLKQELVTHTTSLGKIDQKIVATEQTVSKLTGELHQVRTKAAQEATTFAATNSRVQEIEASVTSQMSQIKAMLESMKKMLAESPAATSGKTLKTAAVLSHKEGAYTVRPGDTLGKIAQQNRTSVAKLRELNQLSSDRIHAGQQLLIPTENSLP